MVPTMTLQFPKRVSLANTPTPLMHLQRTSLALGVEFYVKRDDMTGAELSGNKVRKLEYLIADAIEKGCDTLITGGGEQSNHCRATALVATRMELGCVVCLRTKDKSNPPATSANILLDRLAGAQVVWIDHEDWAHQQDVYETQAKRVRDAGKTPYIIPEGGSDAVGTWGYISCSQELDAQLRKLPAADTTIVYACGSGGTGAGLALGAKHYDFAARGISLAGFNVCNDRDYFVKRIDGICKDFETRYQQGISVETSDIEIIDGYVGLGYAKSQPAELACLRDMARRDAIIFDPVYTGKAFFGAVSELAKNPNRFGKRIVFVHTGGIFGLFPAAKLFDQFW